MNKEIIEVLTKIENAGFEAYIVGGYVRDYLLSGQRSSDIDICTNALPKDLNEIFVNGNNESEEYGAYKIITDTHQFDITTYRKDLNYSNRKPTKVEYVNNLLTDLNRRDFTINAICMNKNGDIIDLLNGEEDLKNNKIRVIGNIAQKFSEDPLRILRAIRFSTILNFEIEASAEEFIKNNPSLIETLSPTRIKYELDCILISPNADQGFKLLDRLNVLSYLKIQYTTLIPVLDINAMWAQLDSYNNYQFTKEELRIITDIKKIVKIGIIDNTTLFDYGLYLCGLAGKILDTNFNNINIMYQKLPIKNLDEIEITSVEIINLLNIKPSSIIKIVYQDLKEKILSNELENNNEDIKKYIINKKEVWLNDKGDKLSN